jgi:hypothetical protein
MRWAGHVARMGEDRKLQKVLVGKPEGKRPLGRPRRTWKGRIRMNLRDSGLGGVDWIRMVQDRDRWRAVVSAVMNLRVLAPQSLLFVQRQLFGNNQSEIRNKLQNAVFWFETQRRYL